MRAWVVAVAVLAAVPSQAEVLIRASNGRVDVQATGAPLSEVLDRLAKQTGMKVSYDGAPQRMAVNLTLTNRTPAEAVLGILDGLGINFALKMDLTGSRVDTLLISGLAAASSSPAPTSAPVRTFQPPTQAEPEDEPQAEEEPEAAEEAPAEQPLQPGAPGVGVAPGGGDPSAPPSQGGVPGRVGIPQAGVGVPGAVSPVMPGIPTSPFAPPNPLFPGAPQVPIAGASPQPTEQPQVQ